MDKKALRKQFLQLRLAKQWNEEQLRIIEHLKAYFSSRTFRCVGLYWPIKNEIDVRSIRELCSQGFIERLALPRLEGQRMRFFLLGFGNSFLPKCDWVDRAARWRRSRARDTVSTLCGIGSCGVSVGLWRRLF